MSCGLAIFSDIFGTTVAERKIEVGITYAKLENITWKTFKTSINRIKWDRGYKSVK